MGFLFSKAKVSISGNDYFVVYLPLYGVDNEIVGMAFAGKPESLILEELRGTIIQIFILSVIILILCCVEIAFVAGWVKKPLVIIADNLKYLADGDLAKFEKVTRVVWEGYHEYEYDAENESLLLTYPSKGVEINIKGNDPSGIIFYSNYYFTDELKETIKNGDFTLNKDEDLIQKTEMKRRNNI